MSNASNQIDFVGKSLPTLLAQAPAPSGVGTYTSVLDQQELNDPEEGDPSSASDYVTKNTAERGRIMADLFLAVYEAFAAGSSRQVGRVDSDGPINTDAALTVGTTLVVTGLSTLAGGLVVTGDADISAAATVGTTLVVTGLTTAAGALVVTGDATISDQIFGSGAASADGVAGFDEQILGDGVGDRGAAIFAGVANKSRIGFMDTTAVIAAAFGVDHNTGDRFEWAHAGTDSAYLTTADFTPATLGGLSLGTAALPWSTGFLANIALAGAVVADGPGGASDAVVGDGVGSRGITIFGGVADALSLVFTDVSGAVRGRLDYTNSNDRLNFATAGVGVLTLFSGALFPTTGDTMDLGGGGNRFQDLFLSGALNMEGDLNHDGLGVGFFSASPTAQSAAYTRTATVVESRILAANAVASIANNNAVLAAIIADMQATGLFG